MTSNGHALELDFTMSPRVGFKFDSRKVRPPGADDRQYRPARHLRFRHQGIQPGVHGSREARPAGEKERPPQHAHVTVHFMLAADGSRTFSPRPRKGRASKLTLSTITPGAIRGWRAPTGWTSPSITTATQEPCCRNPTVGGPSAMSAARRERRTRHRDPGANSAADTPTPRSLNKVGENPTW